MKCLGSAALAVTLWSCVAGSAFAGALPELRVQGKNIVDSNGTVVSLRGTNFGGWLMMETWIPSIEMEWHDHLPRLAKEAGILEALKQAESVVGEFNDDEMKIQDYVARLHQELQKHADPAGYAAYMARYAQEPGILAAREMDEVLRQRFGDYCAARIWNAYHDQWIQETDFMLAKALGFNFVRIPFWYRWFESDQQPYRYNDYAFGYLDKAVDWAEQHGLYVLLDFHGAPGGQSPWDHTGELSRGEFFQKSEYQKRTAALWKHIAKRYADNPTVWGYDLLNEPFSAKGVKDWTKAHDMIYDAIREVDPTTICVMEDGYKLEFEEWMHSGFFPQPKELGWENVVYSFHFYSGADPLFTDDKGLADHPKRALEVLRIGRMEQDRCNVPIYLGEFSTMGDHPNDIEGMRHFLTLFNEEGWHWSPWTWKYVDDNNEGTIWGIYQFAGEWPGTPNFYRDSEGNILEVIGRYKRENFRLYEPYGNILRACLSQPVHPAE